MPAFQNQNIVIPSNAQLWLLFDKLIFEPFEHSFDVFDAFVNLFFFEINDFETSNHAVINSKLSDWTEATMIDAVKHV